MADIVVKTSGSIKLLTKNKYCDKDIIVRVEGGGGGEAMLQEKTVTPTGLEQTVLPDNGYDGLSSVTVNPIPSNYVVPVGDKIIDKNGTYDVKNNAYAVVNVQPNLGTHTITENGTYYASDFQQSGKMLDGFSSVTVMVSGAGGGGADISNIGETLTLLNSGPMYISVASTSGAMSGMKRVDSSGNITTQYQDTFYAGSQDFEYLYYATDTTITIDVSGTMYEVGMAYIVSTNGNIVVYGNPVPSAQSNSTGIYYYITGGQYNYLKASFYATWFSYGYVNSITMSTTQGLVTLGVLDGDMYTSTLTFNGVTVNSYGGSMSAIEGISGAVVESITIDWVENYDVSKERMLTELIMGLPQIFSETE